MFAREAYDDDVNNTVSRMDIGVRILTIALAVGVGLLLLPYLSGLIGAAVLYVVALPVVHRLDRSGRRHWAPFLTILLVFVILVLPALALLAELLAQVPVAARSLQRSVAVTRLMALDIGDLNIGHLFQLASSEIISWSSRQTITAISGVVNASMNLIIALFGAYYLLTSSEAQWDRAKASLPFAPTTLEVMRVRFHKVTEGMLLGVVLTCATQGTLVGLAFAVLGVPQPVLWGAVTAVVSLLPMFGSALVWLPGVAVLAAQDRFAAAAVLAVLGAVLVSNIDNALRLVVYRRVSHVHPMVTLLGAFAGVRAFGVAGLLIGPLLLCYGIELARIYRANGAVVVLESPAADARVEIAT